MTGPRRAILGVLGETEDHLSAKDIYVRVSKLCPSCGITTVYRTIEVLVSSDIVVKLDFGDGQARYELSRKYGRKPHHHHLVCVECSRVIDYSDFIEDEVDLVRKTEAGLAKKFDFEITEHEILFKGICPECRGESSA